MKKKQIRSEINGMLQYFDELVEEVSKLHLSTDDIFIVGSGAITIQGGRKNNDIEFSVSSQGMKKLPLMKRFQLLFLDHVDINKNVDLFRHRYLCVGIKDDMILQRKMYSYYQGYRIVLPEIELAYKRIKKRSKDMQDFKTIKANQQLFSSFNWEEIDSICGNQVPLLLLIYEKFRNICWRYYSAIKRRM